MNAVQRANEEVIREERDFDSHFPRLITSISAEMGVEPDMYIRSGLEADNAMRPSK